MRAWISFLKEKYFLKLFFWLWARNQRFNFFWIWPKFHSLIQNGRNVQKFMRKKLTISSFFRFPFFRKYRILWLSMYSIFQDSEMRKFFQNWYSCMFESNRDFSYSWKLNKDIRWRKQIIRRRMLFLNLS